MGIDTGASDWGGRGDRGRRARVQDGNPTADGRIVLDVDRRADHDVPIILDGQGPRVEGQGPRVEGQGPPAADRIAELEQEVANLRRAAALKEGFLRTVAHDLQNPMSVIKGMAETLLDAEGRLPPRLVPELSRAIVRQTRRVLATLDDLLSIDRLALTRPEPLREWVDVKGLVTDIVDGLVENTPVEVELEEIEASLDPALIVRVVENLLRNAIEHQGDRATVRVTVSSLDDPSGWFAITVLDHGPGVRPEDRERMFHPYFRGDRRGVGLSIVKLFTELHGGQVVVEDAPGGGTAFVVRLPRRPNGKKPDSGDRRVDGADRRAREGLDRRLPPGVDRRARGPQRTT